MNTENNQIVNSRDVVLDEPTNVSTESEEIDITPLSDSEHEELCRMQIRVLQSQARTNRTPISIWIMLRITKLQQKVALLNVYQKHHLTYQNRSLVDQPVSGTSQDPGGKER